MTNAACRMEAEGLEVKDECVAELSPYQTEHINRFEHYALNFSRTYDGHIRTASHSEGTVRNTCAG